jgi:hypothetical protein
MDNAETVTLHPVKIQKLLREILPAFIGHRGEGMVGQFTFLLIISPFQGWMRRISGEVPLFSVISPGSAREN